ncbi:MAG: DUF5320 domain-containing protein [Actinobacteria bacterium]|nr:DUF5320 domain-containing protein [Actinomycetota bacterium]
MAYDIEEGQLEPEVIASIRGWVPMTGRGAGYCAGSDAPGFGAPGFGRGMGLGGGRGRRNRFLATGFFGWRRSVDYGTPYAGPGAYGAGDPEVQKQGLKSQLGFLESALDFVKKRLADLESQDK